VALRAERLAVSQQTVPPAVKRPTRQPFAGPPLFTSLTSVKTTPSCALAGVAEIELDYLARKTGSPSTIVGDAGTVVGGHEGIEGLGGLLAVTLAVGRDPARQRELRSGRSSTSKAVFIASSRTRSTSSCSGPTTPTSAGEPSCGRNTCTTPSSASCCSASFSFLAFIASGQPHAAQDFRREARHAEEGDVLALGQRVADPQRAVVRDADDVAGVMLRPPPSGPGRRRIAGR
jgi:hypothetical protein